MSQTNEADAWKMLADKLGGSVDANHILNETKASGGSPGDAAQAVLESGIFAGNDDALRACYRGSSALQAEFPTEASFMAYRRAAARGGAKLYAPGSRRG